MAFFVLATIAVGEARANAPTPTTAQPGMPNSIAVIGDSMSVATGTTGIPASEQPQNSWSTGTNATVNSLYQRLLAINPAISGKNYNLASNGEDMLDGPAMANAAPLDTRLVTLQLGGNNLCKSNVASMTTVEVYRDKFVETLNILADRVPNALIQIQSVPDIFNLWFLRGAPNPPNDQPSSRAGTARLFWGLGLIPCESLVTNPTSMAQADIDRREAVRTRNIEYNKILAEECEARLRCRFDRYATFNFSSNRLNPPNGDYAPRNTWQFVDDDISTIDHFHPGMSGQTKMAQAAWESGYDFADVSMPSSTETIVPAPPGSGISFLAPTVTHTWNDAGGIKGVQVRTHHNDIASAWQTVAGSTDVPLNQSQPYSYTTQRAVSVPVSAQGLTYVESRALDANGNLSASRVTTVNYDPSAIPAPTITSNPPAQTSSTSASFAFTGAVAGSSYQCSLDGEDFAPCTSPKTYSSLADGDHQFRVRLTTSGGNGTAVSRGWNIDSTPPAAPELSGGPAALVNHSDAEFQFTGEAGGSFECSLDEADFTACTSPVEVSGLDDGDHQFAVRQIDQVGNTGPEASHSWEVDTTPPAAPEIGPTTANIKTSLELAIYFKGEPGGSFECRIGEDAWSACSSPWQATFPGDGTHSFQVRQTDDAGNTGPAATSSDTFDVTPLPAPTVLSAPSGVVRSTRAEVTFTVEPGATAGCTLDGVDGQMPCNGVWVRENLSQGAHRLEIQQVEPASFSPITVVEWTVDTVAPKLKGKPVAKAKGKAKKRKPRNYVLQTAFVPAQGKPVSLEFTTVKKKPKATKAPVKKQTRKWKKKLNIKSKKKLTWVRVVDQIGNWSAWVKVR